MCNSLLAHYQTPSKGVPLPLPFIAYVHLSTINYQLLADRAIQSDQALQNHKHPSPNHVVFCCKLFTSSHCTVVQAFPTLADSKGWRGSRQQQPQTS